MIAPLISGHYYITPTWQFKHAQTLEEAQKQNPLKIWYITSSKELDKALEEAGNLRCTTENTFIGKIDLKF